MTHDDVVLVGVDGSATSLHALDWAAAEARAHGYALRLVCSYALPAFTAASLDGGYAALDDTAIQAGAKAVLSEAQARAQTLGVSSTASVVTGSCRQSVNVRREPPGLTTRRASSIHTEHHTR